MKKRRKKERKKRIKTMRKMRRGGSKTYLSIKEGNKENVQ